MLKKSVACDSLYMYVIKFFTISAQGVKTMTYLWRTAATITLRLILLAWEKRNSFCKHFGHCHDNCSDVTQFYPSKVTNYEPSCERTNAVPSGFPSRAETLTMWSNVRVLQNQCTLAARLGILALWLNFFGIAA